MQRLVLCALTLTALAGVAVGRVEAVGTSRTVPLHGTLQAAYNPTKCPAGTPMKTEGSLTPCYLVIAHGTITSLGKVVDRRVIMVLHSTTDCPRVKFSIALAVRTKGTVLANASKRCVDLHAETRIIPFTVTGGTGAFASAAGGGTITVKDAGYGFESETWKGSLVLPK